MAPWPGPGGIAGHRGYRQAALGELRGRLGVWPVGVAWYPFVLLFPLAARLTAAGLDVLLGGTPPVPFSARGAPGRNPLALFVPVFAGVLLQAGPAEEIGWRGFALPYLRVDWAVNQALSRGLVVVINTHHYEELARDPQGHRERFLALWAQIAERYQGYPDDLLFEPLNEPHDNLTALVWNRLLEEVIDTIRQTNPTRTLVVGPANWNNIDGLGSLQLPETDRRLIVTFHYYNPFQFTHQGAEWVQGSKPWLGTTWTNTPSEERAVIRDLDKAASWAKAHGRPLYMGEFGAYSKANIDSRARWTSFVARQAEERGISWAYWEFCSGFGVYDSALKRWNEPLLEALLPPKE